MPVWKNNRSPLTTTACASFEEGEWECFTNACKARGLEVRAVLRELIGSYRGVRLKNRIVLFHIERSKWRKFKLFVGPKSMSEVVRFLARKFVEEEQDD